MCQTTALSGGWAEAWMIRFRLCEELWRMFLAGEEPQVIHEYCFCFWGSQKETTKGLQWGEREWWWVKRVCVCVSCSVVSDSFQPHVARQAPLSVGFSRQEYWRGLPFPSPGNLPDPGIEPGSPTLEADSMVWATREAPMGMGGMRCKVGEAAGSRSPGASVGHVGSLGFTKGHHGFQAGE